MFATGGGCLVGSVHIVSVLELNRVGCGFCGCLICVTVASASAPDFMHARLCHSVVVA